MVLFILFYSWFYLISQFLTADTWRPAAPKSKSWDIHLFRGSKDFLPTILNMIPISIFHWTSVPSVFRVYREERLHDSGRTSFLSCFLSSINIILLQIGSNDLCDRDLSPISVANSILKLVDDLNEISSVRHVIVLQLINRHTSRNPAKNRFNLDVTWYKPRVN